MVKRFYLYLFFLLMVMKVDGQVITTVAGNGTVGYTGDGGAATAAEMHNPASLALDRHGNLFFADVTEHCIRKLSAAGVISTITGNGWSGYTVDGYPATAAQLAAPMGLAVDVFGNIYYSDSVFGLIRKIDTTGILTTVAGNDSFRYYSGGFHWSSFLGDGGPATSAHFNEPAGLAVDSSGNIYVADSWNSRVRKITPAGNISTFAGNGIARATGDGGQATAASIVCPYAVAVDNFGNVYIADIGAYCIRKVSTSGIISTIAGSDTIEFGGFSGDGGPATLGELYQPMGIAVDRVGSLYIADQLNNRIRKVDSSGEINTFAGIGGSGYTSGGYGGDGGPAAYCQLNFPYGVAIDSTGNLFLSDYYNHRVRMVNTCRVPIVDSIEGVPSICAGSTYSFSDLAVGGTWVSRLTDVATISSSGVVYGISAGVDTVTYSISNSCGTVFSVYPFTVMPIPEAGTITGMSSVCVGSSIALSDSIAVGEWLSVGPTAIIDSSGILTGVSAGIDTVNYRVTSTCGSNIATKSVTILPLPDAGRVVTSEDTVCVGAATVCYDSTRGGTWGSFNGAIATVATYTGLVTGVGAGTDTLFYTVSNSCGTVAAYHVLEVNPLPYSGAITGLPDICIGVPDTFRSSVGGGIWTSATDTIAAIDSNGVARGISSGIDTIFYLTSNSCGTAITSQTITVNMLPSVVLTIGADSICPGYTIAPMASVVGGTWLTSNPDIITVTSSGIVTAVSPGSDTLIYIASSICGVDSASLLLTVREEASCVSNVVNLILPGVSLYPNPATSLLTVEGANGCNISVFDVVGREVLHLPLASNNQVLDISGLESGVYFVHVVDAVSGYSVVRKVVKE